MYYVAKIIGTHGLKGYLKAVISNNLLGLFQVNEKFYVHNIAFFLSSLQKHKKFFLIKFQNLDTLSQVLQFKSADIYSNNSIFFKNNNLYLYQDLVNKAVYDQNKTFLGDICFIREVPQGYLLEIKRKCGQILLVPFVDFFVDQVEIDKVILKNSIEGLL